MEALKQAWQKTSSVVSFGEGSVAEAFASFIEETFMPEEPFLLTVLFMKLIQPSQVPRSTNRTNRKAVSISNAINLEVPANRIVCFTESLNTINKITREYPIFNNLPFL